MSLTATKVKNLKASPNTRRYFDGAGLYLEVTPKGGKYWRLKYRYDGKEKRLALGVYPDVSLADARKKCGDARHMLSHDVDPGEQRKAQRSGRYNQTANSFEVIAREWHTKQAPSWAETYSGRVLSRLERDIFPWLGAKHIASIEAPELLKTIQRIEQRNAIESAHRTLRSCGQIFRYAIASGRARRDPSADIKGALMQVKKGHMAALTEPQQVAGLLRAIDGFDGSHIVRTALKLAPLVFVRPGELRAAEWQHIDLAAAEWRYQVSKTETDHIVPLSRQAVELLTGIQPLTGDGKYVFPNARSKTRPMSDAAMLAALRRLGFSKEEMSVHGFRAIARTLLDEQLGFRVDYIEHQLANAVRDPNGRAYNRTKFLRERRKMMQAWGDYLDGLKSPINVIPIGERSHK